MNTPLHLILGAAAFDKRGAPRVTWAAVLGAFMPDLSLYVMAGGALYPFDTPRHQVFVQLHCSDMGRTYVRN